MSNLPKVSEKLKNKNAIDAVAFKADTLGIYDRHLLLPNPICGFWRWVAMGAYYGHKTETFVYSPNAIH